MLLQCVPFRDFVTRCVCEYSGDTFLSALLFRQRSVNDPRPSLSEFFRHFHLVGSSKAAPNETDLPVKSHGYSNEKTTRKLSCSLQASRSNTTVSAIIIYNIKYDFTFASPF